MVVLLEHHQMITWQAIWISGMLYSTEAKMQLMILIDGLVALVSWRQQISLLTNSKEVDKHPTESKFRAFIETIDLATVLRNSNERHDVVKIQKIAK